MEKIVLTISVFSNESIKEIKKFKFINLKTSYLKGNSLQNLDFIDELQCQNLENIWLRNKYIESFKSLEKYKISLQRINL